jgi:hypothetical protein
MLIPEQFIAGAWNQWLGAAHMKKETAHLPEVGFLYPVFVIFIAGAPLMDRGPVPLKRALIFVQFEDHIIGNGDYGSGYDIMVAGTAGQIDHRLAGSGSEILPQKSAVFFFGKLQSRGLYDITGAESAKRGTGPHCHNDLGQGCKPVHQLFLGMAVFGMEHPGTRRSADNRSFDYENVEALFPCQEFFQELFMGLRGDVGKGGMPEQLNAQGAKELNDIWKFTAQK